METAAEFVSRFHFQAAAAARMMHGHMRERGMLDRADFYLEVATVIEFELH